jgi:hypothetical protein
MMTMLGNVSVRNVRWKAGLLNDWVDSFRHDLEALGRWVEGRLGCLRGIGTDGRNGW